MSGRAGRSWTYARSGIDRGTVREGLAALLRAVTFRPPRGSGRAVPLAGHYAGLVRLGRETIAITTDTVGTKALLAASTGRWEEVGEDIVGVNVNDLASVGARPCGLVDCLSLDRPRASDLAAIGRGLNRGLREAGCALLGGETAIVPELVKAADLGGTAIGFFPGRRRPVSGAGIRPGDVLLGIPSSGFHANGFTLVRRLLRATHANLRRPRPGSRVPLGRELLTPTRIYVRPVEAIAGWSATHGLAHISGGGVRNLARLNPRVRFVVDGWPAPAGLFAWAQAAGRVSDRELYQTFNVGIGFVVVTGRTEAPAVLRRLRANGAPDARPIGRVARGTGVELPQLGLRYADYA